MPKANRVVVAIVSDLHIGSTVALCPPNGIELEDGGRYQPNPAQKSIWAAWVKYWADVRAYAAGAPVIGVVNGEFIEGNHHATTQIASPSPEMMRGAAMDVMQPALGMVHTWYVTKGTAAHSSAGGASDEAIARELGAERDPETNQAAAYHWRIDIQGVLFDFAHHVSGSSRAWTRGTNIRAEVLQMMLEDTRAPDVVVRSHVHVPADTGSNFKTLGVITPAWQLLTEFGNKVSRSVIRSVGGLVFEVGGDQPPKSFNWQRLNYTIAELPVTTWTPKREASTNRDKRSAKTSSRNLSSG